MEVTPGYILGEEIRPINIMLADDHPLLRQALKDVVDKNQDLRVIAEAGDGEEAVRLALELHPDIVIMDITMPKLNGLEAIRCIKEKCPSIAIIVLSVHNDTEHIIGVLEAGACAYLTKSVFGEQVIQAIRAVSAGESVLSPEVLPQLIKEASKYMKKPAAKESSDGLTSRELLTLKLAAKGLSNKDIAQALDLSERTVKSYLAEVFSKLRVASRTEAALKAVHKGLISIGEIDAI